MMSEELMKSNSLIAGKSVTTIVLILVGLCCLLAMVTIAQAQHATKTAATVPKALDTPQAAADALIKAAGAFDVPKLMAILGPDGHEVVASDDPVQDKNSAQAFAKEAAAKNSIQIAKSNPNRATIIVGEEEWPAPIPLVKKNGKWYFNTLRKESRKFSSVVSARMNWTLSLCVAVSCRRS
jgi:hypothetical protein